jgi:WD40 repeat protein
VWIAIGVGYHDFGPPFSPKGEVILADAGTLKVLWHHPAPRAWWANAVAFSPDSSKILVGYGSYDSPMRKKSGSAEVLAQSTGDVLRSFPGLGPEEIGYGDVAFHPDGRTVALGSYERIVLYNLDSQEPIEVISTMQRSSVYALAFSLDGRHLASAGWGRTIHLWDTKTRKLLRRLDGHQGFVRDLRFSPDGRFLASASEDRSVRLWNVETGDLDAVFHGHAFHALSVAWHPAGHLLASGGMDDAIKLWDVRASRPIIKWHFGWPNGIAFDPSSDHGVLATQGHGEAYNHQMRLWNPTTGESIVEPDPWDPASVTSKAEALRVRGLEMPTGFWLAAAAAWSRDGKYFAWLDRLHTIRIREVETGKLVRSLEDEAEGICVLVFTPDGNHLISGGQLTVSNGSKGTVACWDAKECRVKWRRPLGGEWADVAMSPDGRRIAVTDGRTGQLVLLDVSSGNVVATMASDPELAFTCCAFDPGGTRLAVGCSDPDEEFGFVKVLDLAAGRELLRLTGHTGRVNSVAFSPDGRRLASGSWDRTIKLWDTAHGDEVLTLSGHTQGVVRVAFSPDGYLLASGSNDDTVRIWDARPLQEPRGP